MCGFLGFVSSKNKTALLEESLKLIKHRGPDNQSIQLERIDQFYVGFAHARLSIIDLSEEASQPFYSSDQRYSVIYNGEIYNFKELRLELEKLDFEFTTDSDTEVLVNAWAAWGLSALSKFIGMFSFVMLDKKENKLTLVRDAFGIKPFFYSLDNQSDICFGSDIRSLIKLRATDAKPDLQRSYDYLVHGDYDSSESTFVEGIKHLLPGHYLEFDLKSGVSTQPKAWWQPDISTTENITFNEAKEKLRHLFLESIKLHLRSDVPLGIALSGGIDSSAVVSAVRYLQPDLPMQTFSYVATEKNISEEYWIDTLSKQMNTQSHKVYADQHQMQQDLDDMLLKQGEPFGGTSIYAQYRVFKLAKEQGVTVTLDGQGADELLAGYFGYPGHKLLSKLESEGLLAAHKYAKKWAQLPGGSYSLAWQYLGRIKLPNWLYAFARKKMGRDFAPAWLKVDYLATKNVKFTEKRDALSKANKGKRVREALANSLQGRGLPSLLRHGDRNSMAFSLESRVPFLTLPLAEFLLSLPEEYLISDEGVTKHIFREAMRGIVPDEILDRKDKIGFATPESEWLLSMSDTIQQWIDNAPEIAFINKQEIIKEFNRVVSGQRKFDLRVWRWVNYLRWYTLVIEGGNSNA